MDWVLGKVENQSDCGASLGNTKITDLVFADDAVIFAESLEVLGMALEALHEEAKPLGLEVSWLKTKVQGEGGIKKSVTVVSKPMNVTSTSSLTSLITAQAGQPSSGQQILTHNALTNNVVNVISLTVM
ncbi:hypothetical protein GWK47_048652 [Chionoecetes opilio]|uniref:Reverse transcriptase domain-containing protein n=1 Tax=Chionoecetes opilio TaxID=41210 RepID=A0A8J4Y2S7_CHIOP|nr:hypothetical protein GWK47_048652 [Chionoecetes opilio]